MSPSFSQTTPLTCPHRGQGFQTEAWLNVDAAEHPELIEKAKQGTLHDVVCPVCGPLGQLDAPLLLYFPPLPPHRRAGDEGVGG